MVFVIHWHKSAMDLHVFPVLIPPPTSLSTWFLWKDCCWSWNSNTLASWWEELTHFKRPWCWERLKAGGEGDDRGWDGWMASPTQWTWICVNSGNWWWTGRPGVLQFMGSQRVGHDWVTVLNWIFQCLIVISNYSFFIHSTTEGYLSCFQVWAIMNYEYSFYKHHCAGFCVQVGFQLLWINTKECNCWIAW